MKQGVLFAGIDGSGKSTSLDHLIDRLDDSYSIIKIVNLDGSLIVKGEKELVFKRFYGFLQRMRPVSKRYRFYRFFLVLKYFYKLVVIKHVEHFRRCELVMYEIDYLLHPAVYVTHHFPSTQRLSSRTRFRTFSRFFKGGAQPTIFYLDVDPDSAMERIRSRGKEIHAHENQDDLATLRQEFKNVIQAARQDGFYVHTISTTGNIQEDVVNEALRVLVERLGSSHRAESLADGPASRSRARRRGQPLNRGSTVRPPPPP